MTCTRLYMLAFPSYKRHGLDHLFPIFHYYRSLDFGLSMVSNICTKRPIWSRFDLLCYVRDNFTKFIFHKTLKKGILIYLTRPKLTVNTINILVRPGVSWQTTFDKPGLRVYSCDVNKYIVVIFNFFLKTFNLFMHISVQCHLNY